MNLQVVNTVRNWAKERVQWGVPIGKHESLGHKIAFIASTTFAMESIVKLTSYLANDKKLDLRLESAACKEWNTYQGWRIIDETMQIRGGRGYETEQSLASRGETPIPVERLMRDSRINLIFEGSSEIMHLLMAREAVDKHLQVAGAMVDPKSSIGDKISALPKIAMFYAWWYPTRWIKGCSRRARSTAAGRRPSLHPSLRCQAGPRELPRDDGLPREDGAQAGLPVPPRRRGERIFAMTASIARAIAMEKRGAEGAAEAAELAQMFCKNSRRVVEERFYQLWSNDDDAKVAVTKQVMGDAYTWMEAMPQGVISTDDSADAEVEAPAAR